MIDRDEDEDGNVQTTVKVGVSRNMLRQYGANSSESHCPICSALDGFDEGEEKSQEKSGLEGELAAEDILVTLRTVTMWCCWTAPSLVGSLS